MFYIWLLWLVRTPVTPNGPAIKGVCVAERM